MLSVAQSKLVQSFIPIILYTLVDTYTNTHTHNTDIHTYTHTTQTFTRTHTHTHKNISYLDCRCEWVTGHYGDEHLRGWVVLPPIYDSGTVVWWWWMYKPSLSVEAWNRWPWIETNILTPMYPHYTPDGADDSLALDIISFWLLWCQWT
jgi:hypothetical protein